MRNRHRHAVEQALRWMSRRTTQVHSELKGASGTPGYMAPEMLRREVYDHRVDYFSLGCMVVEFVVGVCPFRTRDAAHWGGRKKKNRVDLRNTNTNLSPTSTCCPTAPAASPAAAPSTRP